MSYAPKTLLALQTYWKAQGGVPLGIVGNAAHASGGTSYHLGKDHLVRGAYSARTARDKAGLTNAASAIDLGRLGGSLGNLWEFSRWFAQKCMDTPGYRDVREVIFWSPVRNRVVGWSDLAPDKWINDYGDLSHKTHTHISFYRDSENREKVSLFSAYFATVTEDTMPAFTTWAKPMTATVPTGTWLYDNEACATSAGNTQVSPGRDMPAVGKTAAGTLIIGYIDSTPSETEVKTMWAKPASVTLKSTLVVVTPVDCTPIVAAAIAPLQAQLIEKNNLLATQQIALASWEGYRAAHAKVFS